MFKMKRIIAMILVIALFVGAIPSAFAADVSPWAPLGATVTPPEYDVLVELEVGDTYTDVISMNTYNPSNGTKYNPSASSDDSTIATAEIKGYSTSARSSTTDGTLTIAAKKGGENVLVTVTYYTCYRPNNFSSYQWTTHTKKYWVVVAPEAEVTSFSLSADNYIIGADETATVTPALEITPENVEYTIEYESSNPSVLTVESVDDNNNATVKGTGFGTATITATVKLGDTVLGTATTDPISVYGLSLDKKELTLNSGKTGQLIATTNPSEAEVIWTSSNENAVTVDENGNLNLVIKTAEK